MKEYQKMRINDKIPDTLLICEHPEIVTIGPRAKNDGIRPPVDYHSTYVDRGRWTHMARPRTNRRLPYIQMEP